MIKAKDIYPITVRTTPEGEVQEFITPEDLEQYSRPKDYQSIIDYLSGSTRYIQGIYISDVEGWLNRRPNLD